MALHLNLPLCVAAVLTSGALVMPLLEPVASVHAQPRTNSNSNSNSNSAGENKASSEAAKLPTTPRGWVSRAEGFEQRKKFADAKAAREAAGKLFDERLAKCEAWLKTIAEKTAAGALSPQESAFAATWKRFIEFEQSRAQADKQSNDFYLAELARDKAGIVPYIDTERIVVWRKGEDLSKDLKALRDLEAAGKWTDAHPARREWLLSAKANVRFFKARLAVMENDANSYGDQAERKAESVKKMKDGAAKDRAKKDLAELQDVSETLAGKAAFYRRTLAEAEALAARIESQVNAEQDPATNAAEATFWECMESFAGAYGVPSELQSGDHVKAAAAIAKARGEFYLAKANKPPANSNSNSNSPANSNSNSNSGGK